MTSSNLWVDSTSLTSLSQQSLFHDNDVILSKARSPLGQWSVPAASGKNEKVHQVRQPVRQRRHACRLLRPQSGRTASRVTASQSRCEKASGQISMKTELGLRCGGARENRSQFSWHLDRRLTSVMRWDVPVWLVNIVLRSEVTCALTLSYDIHFKCLPMNVCQIIRIVSSIHDVEIKFIQLNTSQRILLSPSILYNVQHFTNITIADSPIIKLPLIKVCT